MKNTATILNKPQKKKTKELVKVEKQLTKVQKAYSSVEVKKVAEDLGMDLRYLLERIKEQMDSTELIEEPLEVPLLDEYEEPITTTKIINGVKTEIPLTTKQKRINPNTGKVEDIVILRATPNIKAQQWAIELLAKLIITPPSKETNIKVDITKEEISKIDNASEYLKNNPDAANVVKNMFDGDLKAVEAEFEIIKENA